MQLEYKPALLFLDKAFIMACLVAFFVGRAGAQSSDCFAKIHRGQPRDADYVFDLRFDRVASGGSFACDLDVRPSDARKAIDEFRYGVLYESELHLRRAIRFPVSVGIRKTLDVQEVGETVELRTVKEFIEFMKLRLDAAHLTLTACANLRNVTIVKARSYGFMLGAGTVWFHRSPNERRPRVTSLNIGPIPDKALLDECKVSLSGPIGAGHD